MFASIKMTYGIDSNAEGYAVRGIIEGEFGEKKFFERKTKGKSLKNFYNHSNGNMVQTRHMGLSYNQYRKMFG